MIGAIVPHPPNFSFPSPTMHPGQVAYPPGVPSGMPTGPLAPFGHYHMDTNYHMVGPAGLGTRSMPLGDMTNAMYFPPGRGMDPRGEMSRRGSQSTGQWPIFNPYGPDRPDKADFATIQPQPNGRKMNRNGSFNNNGRGRKYSTTSRPCYAQPNLEREDRPKQSGQYTDGSHPRFVYIHPNPDIVNDREYGCDSKWIGPKNTKVTELFVGSFPQDTTRDDLRGFFEQAANVKVTDVVIRFGAQMPHAFVHFASTTEAREGLKLDGTSMKGKQLIVSVPNRHFKFADMSTPREPYSGHSTRATSGSATHMPGYGASSDTPVQYSPQDARSGLPRTAREPQERMREPKRSPELRTLITEPSSVKKSPSDRGDGPNDQEQVASTCPNTPAGLPKAQDSTTIHTDEPPQPKEAKKNLKNQKSVEIPTKGKGKPRILSEDISPENLEGETSERAISGSSYGSGGARTKPSGEAVLEAFEHTPGNTPVKVALPPQTYSPNKGVGDGRATIAGMDSAEQPLPEAAPSNQETGSDDERKNELSFHSAQESQSDHEKKEDKEEVVHVGESASAQPVSPLVPAESGTNVDGSIEPGAALTKSGTWKRSGAKQTESLFPFAKHGKNQTKKEKQARKRDKKKEKEKAKAENVTSSPTTSAEAAPDQIGLKGTNDVIAEESESETGVMADGDTFTAGSQTKLKNEGVSPSENGEALVPDGEYSRDPIRDVPLTQSFKAEKATFPQETMQTQLSDNLHGISVGYSEEKDAEVSADETALTHSALKLEGLVKPPEDSQDPMKKAKDVGDKVAVPKLKSLKIDGSPSSTTTLVETPSSSTPAQGSPTEPHIGAINALEISQGTCKLTQLHISN